MPDSGTNRGGVILALQSAGLLATGWIVWRSAVVPRLASRPLASLFAEALGYSVAAWAWSAAITLLLGLAVLRSFQTRVALRTAATAVWFAPATILLSAFSPVAAAAALVLVASATRLLYGEWREAHAARERRLVREMTVSASLQGAGVALMMRYPLAAAALLALGTAMLTMLLAKASPGKRSLPRSVFGVALTVLLAAGLTAGGVAAYRRGGLSGDDRPGILESLRILLGAETEQATAARVDAPAAPESVDIRDDSFPGVVLWPEVKQHTTLIDPLPAMGTGIGAIEPLNGMTVPFAGEYWMFRPPQTRPPRSSYFRRASPVSLGFHTTDHRALAMKAWHHLEKPIDARCCAAIRVGISNADRFPGTVVLELLLVNTAMPGHPEQSLGKEPVLSAPARRRGAVPVPETLTFRLPGTGLREFDVFEVVFHRDRMRIDTSAKIAIERFILVPRGTMT